MMNVEKARTNGRTFEAQRRLTVEVAGSTDRKRAGNRTGFGRVVHCCLLVLSAILLMVGVPLLAQSTTGSVYGTVSDASGAVIAGAPVTITNVETRQSQTTKTHADGTYLFPTLNPGQYAVSTKVTGFKSTTESGLALSANQNLHANFALEVGGESDSVTVEAGTTLVDTREAQIAETIDQKRIEDLPLNGRSPYNLATILPGVTNFTADSAIGARNGTRFSVNGLPTSTTNFYLDGAQDIAISSQVSGGNILPNPDALQEVRLLTSNFDAEFGRSPGGVLSAITRSGTAKFHGMAYDYIRNDAFNASNYFLNGVTPLKENQFGGNVGGPIWRGDKAFFFLSYEQLIIHTPATVPASLITGTAAERTGDFSADPSTVTAPITKAGGFKTAAGKVCPNPLIVCTPLDPVAQNLLAFVPVYVFNGTGGASAQQESNANSVTRQGLARIDYQLTPKHQIEAMFFTSRGVASFPNVVGNQVLTYSGMNDYENVDNAILADTWVISPSMVNNLRLFYTQNRYIISPQHPENTWASLGSTVAFGGSIFAPPDFVITGYFNEGTNQGGPNDISQLAFGPFDTLTFTHGHQSIKAGGSLIWDKYVSNGGLQDNGILTFTGGTTGNGLADFLEGKANSFIQTTPQIQRGNLRNPALFVQDNWQATKRLSLNLGLRWEVSPVFGTSGEATFKPNVQSTVFPTAPVGLVYPGDPGVPFNIYNTPITNFAPRVGFAYDVFGTGRTSVRGGLGLFYSSDQELGTLNNLPYTLSVTTAKTPNLVAPYAPGVDPFPFVVDTAHPRFANNANIATAPSNGGSTPYVYEYNLTLEQQLGRNWGARLAYVGNDGHKFYVNHDINTAVYIPGAATTTAALDCRRPYEPYRAGGVANSATCTYSGYAGSSGPDATQGSQFGAITVRDPIDDTHYNSLQATLRGTVTRRFSVLASYVWSKAFDFGYGDGFVDGNDIRKQRGLADIDQRNTFVVSYIYHLPGTNAFGFVGKEILSGWQLNGITSLHSGSPFTVTSGVDTNLDGTNNDRPNVVGIPYLPTSRSRQAKIAQFFNPAAFAVPTDPANPYGNEQRNLLISAGYVNTDLSVFKEFAVTERARLQFRAEAYNAYGNVNLGNPAVNIHTATAGLITSAGSPRILQFALKALF